MIYPMKNDNDTIVAIASGLTDYGIGIIRVSGDDAISTVNKIFVSKKFKSLEEIPTYHAAYGNIVADGEVIDEVIVLLMRAPHTYTREDVVEIDCHGGITVMKRIMEACIKCGARPAEPGEFTKRAFLNGRIDLSQAESVMDLINAKNDLQAKASIKQLKGSLSNEINRLREAVIKRTAFIEAALDDPEHYELDGFSDELLNDVNTWIKSIDKLIATYDSGRFLKEGINTLIVGKPNAGKSSLLNTLLGQNRAIVTDVAGTTRDTLEETLNLDGILLNIIDTAGIRNTDDIVEKLGVEKAETMIDDADLILYVVDSSTPLDDSDHRIMDRISTKNVIILWNKSDLSPAVDKLLISSELDKPIVEISAKNGEGIDILKDTIKTMFFKGEINFNDELVITSLRHKTALANAENALQKVRESIKAQMPEDFFTIDLMKAYEELGLIIGESLEDDLVDKIFNEFCMGK